MHISSRAVSILAVLVTLLYLGGCATPNAVADIGASTVLLPTTSGAYEGPTSLQLKDYMRVAAGSNSCTAQSRGVCSGCQTSCPANKQAICRPGVESCTGSIETGTYKCECRREAQCDCK